MSSTISDITLAVNRLVVGTTDTAATKPQYPEEKTEKKPPELHFDPDKPPPEDSPSGKSELTEKEKALVEQLKKIDAEVREHEQSHKAAAGSYANGSAIYKYKVGPDGRRYAIAGEVHIDTSPIRGNPEATIAKMRRIRQAASAPAEPSTQDSRVAAQALRAMQAAEKELAAKRASELGISGSPNLGGPANNLDQKPIIPDLIKASAPPDQPPGGATAEESLAAMIRARSSTDPGTFIDVAA